MQPLPNIEVLAFLNWMDIHGHSFNNVGIPIEELFLNSEYRDLVRNLEEEYIRSRSKRSRSEKGAYEQCVDLFLAELKRRMMKEYRPQSHLRRFNDYARGYGRRAPNIFASNLERVLDSLDLDELRRMGEQFDITPINMDHYFVGNLSDSVWGYLQYGNDPVIFDYFLRQPNSVVKTTVEFLEWVQNECTLQRANLRNIPADVMKRYIHNHIWGEYQSKRMSEPEKCKKENLLCRVLIEQEYNDYLGNILTHSDLDDYTLDAVVRRSFNRSVRYKCTLLAEDDAFRILVRDHWEDMNTCSGNHLDIYYSETELEQRGRSTADKLQIRNKITQYPAIYMWEYRLNEGICIPVGGLDSHELMNLFRIITDKIAKGDSLNSVADSANEAVGLILRDKNKSREQENKFTAHLLDACSKLQNNENWVRNTDENGRNAYIKDMLTTAGYQVYDQTLGGISPTRKSAGELDLKVLDADGKPLAIVEALNTNGVTLTKQDTKNICYHVNKVYTYDSNGLSRNYVVIYAATPKFGEFTEAVFRLLASPEECPYGDAEFLDIGFVDTEFTDLGLACANYLRNGKETRLYILCVRIAERTRASH